MLEPGFRIVPAGGIRIKMEAIRLPAGSCLPIMGQVSGTILMRKDICRPDGLQIRTGTAITSMPFQTGPEDVCIPAGT